MADTTLEGSGHITAWVGLRAFIERAEAVGEVEHVSGAHWDREMSTISHEVCRGPRDPSPALIFDDIPDYPSGYRTMFGMTNSVNRLAVAVGMSPGYDHPLDFLRKFRSRRREMLEVDALDPAFIDPAEAPVMENADTGDAVDLVKFPVPHHHEFDGGRFIGTACCFITDSPDTGRVNVGTYRVQVFEPDQCGVLATAGKHGRLDIEDYEARDEPVPVAASFGQDPVLFMFSSIGIEPTHPYGEFAHAGGLKGAPFPVVEGPVTGLPLPARAEIVMEGFIEPGKTRLEGPFGEWAGYYGREADLEPVIDVEAIYHRDDPIMTCAVPAKPPYDYSYHKALVRSATAWDYLETAGVPGVVGVWRPEAGGTFLLTVVSIDQRYPGHARQAGMIASHARGGGYSNRFTIVVDEDIDPTSWEEVAWAMATRCDPATDLEITRREWTSPIDPLVEHAGTGPGKKDLTFNSRALVDATIPYERLETFPKVAEAPAEYAREIRQKWRDVVVGPD